MNKIKGISKKSIIQAIKFRGKRSFFMLPFVALMMVIQYICSYLLYIVLKNKKKGKAVIGFSDIYYTGNTRAVFEWMLKNKNKYEAFWVTKNFRTLRDVKSVGGKAFHVNGLIGLSYFLKADAWVVAHVGLRNIPCLPHRNYKLVQLWHGIGPKGINHTKEDYEIYDAWCVASELSKQRHIELWNAPQEKLYVTGFAEMDRLFCYLRNNKEDFFKEIGIKNAKKTIIYAPTYDVGLWPWEDKFEEFEKFCNFCNKNNLILILRLHPYAHCNKRKIKKIINKYDHIYWLDMQKEPDTMKVLAIADILITDWSSIYTDYFLTERPIIYLEVNEAYYTKMRGKPEIPPEFRAGEIAHNAEEFYISLKIVLEKGNRFEENQEKLLKIIHGNVDGKASERVVVVIEKLLNS